MIRTAFGPDFAAVLANYPLDVCQSDSAPRVFGLPVQPLERLEQLVRKPHVEPYAVVANEEHTSVAADLYLRAFTFARILACIVEKILENDTKHRCVSARRHLAGDLETCARVAGALFGQVIDNFFRKLRKSDRQNS